MQIRKLYKKDTDQLMVTIEFPNEMNVPWDDQKKKYETVITDPETGEISRGDTLYWGPLELTK